MNNKVKIPYEKMLEWLEERLLRDELRLNDIPKEVRISRDTLYVCAFRISRNVSCRRFISDLEVLCNDIIAADGDNDKQYELTYLLSSTIQICDFKGDSEFEYFKKDMDKKVLQQLQRYKYAHGEQLQAAFREYQNK